MSYKKPNNVIFVVIGILVFLISYKLDRQVNLFFKSFRLPFLDFIFSIITNFGLVVFITLIVPIIILYKKNRKFSFLLIITFLASFTLAFIIKLIVLRQRPAEILIYPFINIIDYSFPSTHSMVVFSLLPALIKWLPKQKYYWLAFAFLVAFSRVYFGVHYLSDVAFGAFFGYFLGFYLLLLYKKRYANKQI